MTTLAPGAVVGIAGGGQPGRSLCEGGGLAGLEGPEDAV